VGGGTARPGQKFPGWWSSCSRRFVAWIFWKVIRKTKPGQGGDGHPAALDADLRRLIRKTTIARSRGRSAR
jgi:hypothetical protein